MNILVLVRGRQERVKMSFLGESKSGRLKEKNGNLPQLFLTILHSLLLPFSPSPHQMGYNHHLIAFCNMYS